jgi:hypothetical protein
MAIPQQSCSVKNRCFASSIPHFCGLWPGAAMFPWHRIMSLLQSSGHYDGPHFPGDVQATSSRSSKAAS